MIMLTTILLVCVAVQGQISKELKCAACSIVVDEIGNALPPTLQTTEDQALDLLEAVCKQMPKYMTTTLRDGTMAYEKHGELEKDGSGVKGLFSIDLQGSKEDQQKQMERLKKNLGGQGKQERRELGNFCDALVEEHEEKLVPAIQKIDGLREKVCVE
jgi:hypothetical protein